MVGRCAVWICELSIASEHDVCDGINEEGGGVSALTRGTEAVSKRSMSE